MQSQGYKLPEYPENPKDDKEKDIKARYDKVKGSAVNPVLREGNSDRRAPLSVKAHTRKHPHKMGAWSPDSKTHVSHMKGGDFRSNEKSMTMTGGDRREDRVRRPGRQGTVLKPKVALQAGEVIDATFMSKRALRQFLEEQIEDAKKQGVLFSLHMKATMMKISDPKIFGHAVTVYYKDVFEKHGETLKKLGVDPDNGIGDLYAKIKALPDDQRKAIEADIQEVYKKRPPMAMVNSDKGITNLHVPSDIIIDASMPPVIRDSGKMWNPEGKLQDTKCVIPDASYAPVYHEVVEFCKKHGAFDPKTMGSVPNVGLMAQAAEEYGSHDKTFKAPGNGTIRVVDASGKTLAGAQGRRRRYLAHVSGEGCADSGLGQAGGESCEGDRSPGDFLVGQDQSARCAVDQEGRTLLEGSRYDRASTSGSCLRPMRRVSHWSGSKKGRTRSP